MSAARKSYGRRPPLRICPICGGDHYAWSEQQACRRCRDDVLGERTALAEELKRRRLERRARLGL